MEVFVCELPLQLSEWSFKIALQPHMNALGIVDYTVSKPQKSPKRFGFVVFLHEADGKLFLAKYKSPGPTRLMIMGVPAVVRLSNTPAKPLILAVLRWERDQRLKAAIAKEPEHRDVYFRPHSLCCGHTMFSASSDSGVVFVRQWDLTKSGGTIGVVKFARKTLSISLDTSAQAVIPYSIIKEMICRPKDSSFILVLTQPPKFYEKHANIAQTMASLSLEGITPESLQIQYERTRLTSLDAVFSSHGHARFAGLCQAYLIRTIEPMEEFFANILELKKRGLIRITEEHIPCIYRPEPVVADFDSARRQFGRKLNGLSTRNDLPFEILFQVEAFVANGLLHPYIAFGLLNEMGVLRQMHIDGQGDALPFSAASLKKLGETHMRLPVPGEDPLSLQPEVLMRELLELEKQLRRETAIRTSFYSAEAESRGLFLVHRAVITPTRILLQGPSPESGNRVLRKFKKHTNYFLRVQFSDEDGEDLHFTARLSQDRILNRFKEVMQTGIQICGRVYGFLGFSHSSLRAHAAWFCASFVDDGGTLQTYPVIIRSLGDFRHIRTPARCAARIGQAFSETPTYIDIAENNITVNEIPDVRCGTRIFSDGVGTISTEAMERIWINLKLSQAAPTCFQIRWGGVKGMLGLDSRLSGLQVCVRPEMKKFPSNDTNHLEICDQASRPLRLYLNRSMIKIMEDMGVDENWFLGQQKAELTRLRMVTATAYNAYVFLQLQNIGINLAFPQFIRRLDLLKIDYRRDKFLRGVVELAVLKELRLLKYKARIPVKKGVALFGIMDETGFLEDGQVLVTFDTSERKTRNAIEGSPRAGRVIVTRSPALHPGDIQIAMNVIPPPGHPLTELRNSIVFSQKGARDLPSQLSGGDLDGDQFQVIWDMDAMPKKIFSAADYPRAQAQTLDREVNKDDMIDFFVNFMKTDQLGRISNRHMVLADFRSEGTTHPQCILLAEMASTAVDYSKTGVPVDVSKMPRVKFRPDL
jgi:hypothetical protein